MGYKAFIFDFDGTLVDTLPDIVHYANEILVEFGYAEKNSMQIRKAIGRGVHELLKELGFSIADDRLEQAVAEFKKRYTQNPFEKSRLFEGALEMLVGELAGCKKAIVTNKPHNITEQMLQSMDLAKYFDFVVGEGGSFPTKPDPMATLKTMEVLGVAKSQTVFIGDSVVDYQTAKNAGIDFVCMTYGYDDEILGYKDVVFFESTRQWAKLVNSGGR